MHFLAHASHCNICNKKSLAWLQGLAAYKGKYAVDEVHYTENMADILAKLQPSTLHLLCGTNSDRSCILACETLLCPAMSMVILLYMTLTNTFLSTAIHRPFLFAKDSSLLSLATACLSSSL